MKTITSKIISQHFSDVYEECFYLNGLPFAQRRVMPTKVNTIILVNDTLYDREDYLTETKMLCIFERILSNNETDEDKIYIKPYKATLENGRMSNVLYREIKRLSNNQ